MKELLVHLFHILIIGSLFLYVGIAANRVYAFMYPLLLALGGIIILYHGYKTVVKWRAHKNPWVNLIHVLVVGPLLLYIGYNGVQTPYFAYELLLMLGFASIGYHGYYAIMNT